MNIPDPSEHRTLRESTRRFCDTEVHPVLGAFEREEAFPAELAQSMAAQGYLGCLVPREQGGAGLDDWAYAVVMEEFGRYMSLRQIITVQTLVTTALIDWGSDAMRSAYLSRLARGEILGAYALTEPSAGSDAQGMRLRAERDGGDWVLNGQKTFITLGNSAHVFLVFAKTGERNGNDKPDDDTEGTGGQQKAGRPRPAITAFLVERDWGVSTTPLKGKLGQRSSDTANVFFTDVRVPDANRLGAVGQGFKIAMVALDNSRIEVASASVGSCQASLDLSTRYALQREQFGRKIAGFQLVQDHIAKMVVDTDASRMLAAKAIAAKLSGEPFSQEASVAKYFASEAAVRCANRAIQVHGGYGYFEDYEVERLARDARILTIYEGTSEIQKLLIASHHTGVKAFI